MILKGTISAGLAGRRLDEALTLLFSSVSKGEARRIIDRGGCSVNSAMVRVASRGVRAGDLVEIGLMEPGRFKELELSPSDLLYEDGDLIAVNKPAGINTQRTPYQLKGTLEYWVSEYFRRNGSQEPARVVHRLDRGTSGVMVFPKHKRAAAWLSSAFHDGLMEKRYLSLVAGVPPQTEWLVDGAIGKIAPARYGIVAGGRTAATRFRLVARGAGCSLVEAVPLTGRTHQIRVHLESVGLPIIGDAPYGGIPAARMMLHCAGLAFRSELGVAITLTAPLDAAFKECLAHSGISL